MSAHPNTDKLATVAGAGVHLDRSTVVNATASGIFLQPGARATLSRCNICNNGYCGLSVAPEAVCFLKDCTLRQNVCAHVAVKHSRVLIQYFIMLTSFCTLIA
jgi:hypothetical protein